MNSLPSFPTDDGDVSPSAAHSDAIYSDPQVLAAVQEAKARLATRKTARTPEASLAPAPTNKDKQHVQPQQGGDGGLHKRFVPPNMSCGDVGPTIVFQPQVATLLSTSSSASSLAGESAISMSTSLSSDNSQILASLNKILQYQQAFSIKLESHDSKLEILEQRIGQLGETTATKKKCGKRASVIFIVAG